VSTPEQRTPRRIVVAALLLCSLMAFAVAASVAVGDDVEPLFAAALGFTVPGLLGGLLVGSFFSHGPHGERIPPEDRWLFKVFGLTAAGQALGGCLLTPLTGVGDERVDFSWFAVAVVAMGMGSLLGMLVGWIVALLVVKPVMLAVRFLPAAARGDRDAIAPLAFGLLLPTVVAQAVALRAGTGRGLRDGALQVLGQLIGVGPGALTNGWLWAARLLTLLVVSLLIVLVRPPGTGRRSSPPEEPHT